MLKNESEKDELEALIAQINELLIEIKDEQKNMQKTITSNHKVNMQKFSKLIEYNKIAEKDLIKIDRFEKKNKTRFDDGKYIAIPGTVEWWINSYKKVVI